MPASWSPRAAPMCCACAPTKPPRCQVSLDGFPEAISRDWEGADLLEFTVANADELARAVAGLGEHALVLKPAQLREHVTRLLRGVVGILATEGGEDGSDKLTASRSAIEHDQIIYPS